MSDSGSTGEPMFTKVVVAVGAGEPANRLVPVAAGVAARAGIPIELVTVVIDNRDDFPEDRRRALEDLVRRHDVADAEVVVLDGWSVPRTLAAHLAEDPPALTCLVSTVHSRLDDLLIGSTAGGVMNAVTTPVLVLGHRTPEGADPSSGPIVVCTDGSSEAEAIIPLAQQWMALTGQTAWVVTQLDPDLSLEPELETRGVRRFAADIGEGVEWEVLHGRDAGGAIARFAADKKAGLIIMATHGRSAIVRAALGSTAMRTITAASCPVLVQRPPSVPVVDDEDPAESEVDQ